MDQNENVYLSFLCGRSNSYESEHDDVTIPVWTGENKVFENADVIYPFLWSNVDGQKRYENASVDANLFMRFRQNENGGFSSKTH